MGSGASKYKRKPSIQHVLTSSAVHMASVTYRRLHGAPITTSKLNSTENYGATSGKKGRGRKCSRGSKVVPWMSPQPSPHFSISDTRVPQWSVISAQSSSESASDENNDTHDGTCRLRPRSGGRNLRRPPSTALPGESTDEGVSTDEGRVINRRRHDDMTLRISMDQSSENATSGHSGGCSTSDESLNESFELSESGSDIVKRRRRSKENLDENAVGRHNGRRSTTSSKKFGRRLDENTLGKSKGRRSSMVATEKLASGPFNEGSDTDGSRCGFKITKCFRASKDSAWHERNCKDSDLTLVETIAAAYPFDASVKKSVSLKEKVHGGLADPTKQSWGSIDVMQLGPPKISCDPCGAFILDRRMETPFYVCKNCRSCGRKFEMCVQCYAAGVLATGPRNCNLPKAPSSSAYRRRGDFHEAGPMKLQWESENAERENAKVVVATPLRPVKKPLRV